ncbi:alpha/beta hydrolase [Nocardioides sp. HM23]|uniref:alpha/beta fold hydrolase n=1 Tax=Nocardioides bizhenqiangii TaxID=3095076 RepID=UPI002ACACA2D|nr:alpha/beta hydrolase [Nocardioides sp. HM23]MDZ5620172.1 alpha/beta hydrolase [Nocardioides sp. HM23]
MTTPPIVLVPGFWLGAWAWDEVAAQLRNQGHDVHPVTLPGLDSPSTDRSSITFADHVDAICDAVAAAGPPVVLAVHSGAGMPGYAVTDKIPDQIAAMVYVDTAPGKGSINPELEGVELPLPPTWEELGENLDGISEEQLARFRERAVPEPAAALREEWTFANDDRRAVPSTIICTAFTSEQYQQGAEEGHSFLAGLGELTDVTWVDLPTSHWPMWSRPDDLATILGDVAKGVGT